MNARVFKARPMAGFGRIFLANVVLCGLLGCGSTSSPNGGGGGTTGPTPLVAGGAGDVFVIQTTPPETGTSILDLAAGTGGNVTPKGRLLVDSDLIVNSIASDSTGRVYVGGYTAETDTQPQRQSISVYAAGATGTATPLQTIYTLIQPMAMTVDSAGDIYAAGVALAHGGTVEEIKPDGTATFFYSSSFALPTGIALDASGNVYVSVLVFTQTTVNGAIQVFAAGSQGTVTPVRTIATNGVAYGVAIDHGGNIYTSVDVQTVAVGYFTTSSASLVEYGGGTTGSSTALKTITANGFGTISGVQVDTVGNLYLLDTFPSSTGGAATLPPEVLGFAGSVAGNTEPAVTLNSSDWTYTGTLLALH